MSPLERILLAPWGLLPALLVVLAHGWTLWFVLGRNFSRTVFITAASRAVIGAGAWWLTASGALGRQDPHWQADTAAWIAAAATAWLLCWALDTLVVGGLMRRMQPGWSWKAYDLVVLGVAQAAYLAGGALRLG